MDQHKREKAITELIRVNKPGAPLFVSVMSRLSVMVIELMIAPHEFEEPFFKVLRDQGDYFGGFGFTACHFFLPEEFANAFRSQGIDILEMAGLEGIGSRHNKKINALAKNELRWQVWMETHFQTCTHPSVIGMAEHILLVGKKAQEDT